MREVLIRKQYRDPVRSMLWGAYIIDDDDDSGTWLFTPAGTLERAEQAGEVLYFAPARTNTLHLCPRNDWWFARWDDDDVTYVDIARPVEQLGREWRYVDLYLDLYRKGDAEVVVDDEDEFEAAWNAGAVSLEERDAAVRTLRRVLDAFRAGAPPLDAAPWHRLQDAISCALAPLTTLPPLL